MPQIVGLTGGIASGKSSVSSIWSSAGIFIVDADAIAREVVEPGRPALWLIKKRFGSQVIRADGTLDRAALGQIIFKDARARAALNMRIHPFIIASMLTKLAKAIFLQWRTIVVLDTPLLFESKTLIPFCTQVVVVSCTPEQQISRMVSRDGASKGLSEEDAKKRLSSQMPLQEKVERATMVIDNSGSQEELQEQAMKVLDKLQPSPAGELVFRVLISSFALRVAITVSRCLIKKLAP